MTLQSSLPEISRNGEQKKFFIEFFISLDFKYFAEIM